MRITVVPSYYLGTVPGTKVVRDSAAQVQNAFALCFAQQSRYCVQVAVEHHAWRRKGLDFAMPYGTLLTAGFVLNRKPAEPNVHATSFEPHQTSNTIYPTINHVRLLVLNLESFPRLRLGRALSSTHSKWAMVNETGRCT